MVLCASNQDKTQTQLLVPPDGSKVGERVEVEGFKGPADEVLNPKHQVFQNAQKLLNTDNECVACYSGVPFKTSTGVVRCESLINSIIG